MTTLTGQAIDHLKKVMKDDTEYAWGWHCNIAMPAYDSGISPIAANLASARIMKHLFDIDITQNPNWATTMTNWERNTQTVRPQS